MCSRGLDEDRARWFYQQLILALDYIHKVTCQRAPWRLCTSACIIGIIISREGSPVALGPNRRSWEKFKCPSCSFVNTTVHGGQKGTLCMYMQMNVSNRDIKLENTLLDTSQAGARPLLKVCDFGYSINESLSLPKTAVGTPGYVGKHTAAQAPQFCIFRSHTSYKCIVQPAQR